jgi:hypothetical protein
LAGAVELKHDGHRGGAAITAGNVDEGDAVIVAEGDARRDRDADLSHAARLNRRARCAATEHPRLGGVSSRVRGLRAGVAAADQADPREESGQEHARRCRD